MQRTQNKKNEVLKCTYNKCKNPQTADGEFCDKHYPKAKTYYVNCDVGEGYPSYDFVVKAKTLKEAIRLAGKELKYSYPENWEYNKNDFSVCEITANELLERLTLN